VTALGGLFVCVVDTPQYDVNTMEVPHGCERKSGVVTGTGMAGRHVEEILQGFVDAAPQMLKSIEDKTSLKLVEEGQLQ